MARKSWLDYQKELDKRAGVTTPASNSTNTSTAQAPSNSTFNWEREKQKDHSTVAKGTWQDFMKKLESAKLSTPQAYQNRTDKSKVPSQKELYESLGFREGKLPRDEQWDNALLEPLSKKKYGNSFKEKLNTIFGNEWAAKDFSNFMTYKEARDTIDAKKATEATQLWESAHNKTIKKQQKKAEETQKLVEDISKERDGFLGFLDSTLGRIGDASHKLFGDEFVKAENENYANLAIDKLEKNPKDKHAKQSIQMLNTTTRAPKNKLEKVSDFIGTAAGELAPYTLGGAYGAADAVLGKLGLNALRNPNMAKDLVRGIAAGTIAGTEKAITRGVASGEKLTPEEYAKRIGVEAALAGGGDALLGGVLRNLNLKGQVGKIINQSDKSGNTISKSFNEQEFKQALEEAFAPKGDVSKVLKESPAIQPVRMNPQQVLDQFMSEWKNPNGTQAIEGPVVLKSLNKDVTQLPKEELKKMYQQLADEHDLNLISGNEAAAKTINEDLTNLEQLIKNGPPKQKTFNPSSIPSVETTPMLDDWFNYAQSGQGPTARGVVPKGNVSRGDRELIGNQADTILGRSDALKNAPKGGYNQRVLDVQQEMKTAMDKRGIYRQPLTPDELYQAVKGENDPATFDELIKLAELENNVANAPVNIKNLLRTDPKIAEAINKLNQLGGGPKKSIPPIADQPNVQSLDEMLNFLSNESTQKQLIPKEKTLSQAMEELNQKYEGLVNGKGKEEAKALQKEFIKERDAIFEEYSNQSLNQSQQLVNSANPTNPLEKLQQFINTTKKTEQGSIPIEPNKIPASDSAKPVNKVENIKPSDSDTADLIDTYAELEASLKNVKDIKQIQVGTKNIYEIADRLPEELGSPIKQSLDTAKSSYVKQLETLTNDLYDNVVEKLGIKAGSKESALVQDFGEKTLAKKYLRKQGVDPNDLTPEELNAINLEQLKASTNKWETILAADQFFRKNYDQLIEQVNQVRKEIYPTSLEKIVPKRNDYYHHFNELTGLEGVRNLFDTPSNIDPHLEGISPHTKPKTKFQGFMQKRMNGAYKSDAVGGYLKYIKAASHSINVDPVISVLRKTKDIVADLTVDSRNANKIVEALEDHAKDLAGKTNPYDRLAQKTLGRGPAWKAVNWLNTKIKGNMVLANLGSMLGQLGNVPLGIGKAKLYAVPGLKNTLEQTTKELFRAEKNAPMYESLFLKERYSDHLFRRFDSKLIQQPKRLVVWMMETADKAGTRFIWNSMYAKGLKEGVQDVIKYADYETRKIVAGRGIGEVPLMQKSKTGQILAPFTLEVGNQWKVFREMVGEKDASGIITALIASYGLNRAIEEVRGSGVSFDPIDAIIDGYNMKDGDKGEKLLNALGSLTGEVVGNIPGGNLITQFANTEKNVPLTDIKFKELFGERNPNRFGTGLTLAKFLQDPLYAVAPFGASQFRKSTQGGDALKNDAVYKGDNGFIPFVGPKEELMYPVNPSTWETLKLPFFGPSSTSAAKDYYNKKSKPLNENQTKVYKAMEREGLGQELYNFYRKSGTKASDKSKASRIWKNENLNDYEKIEQLTQLLASMKK